jgi:hypothetical protein
VFPSMSYQIHINCVISTITQPSLGYVIITLVWKSKNNIINPWHLERVHQHPTTKLATHGDMGFSYRRRRIHFSKRYKNYNPH